MAKGKEKLRFGALLTRAFGGRHVGGRIRGCSTDLSFAHKHGGDEFNLVDEHTPVLLIDGAGYVGHIKRTFSTALFGKLQNCFSDVVSKDHTVRLVV